MKLFYRRLCLTCLSFTLISCGTYRTGTGEYHGGAGGYNGVGKYRAPSDYSKGVDSADYSDDEMHSSRSRLNNRMQYIPHGVFKLLWPVSFVRINRGFRPESDPKHDGLDLGGKKGMPILAAHEGIVIYAGREFNGYGNMVMVEYSNEWATLYGHLDEFAVKEGAVVSAGEPIGSMGSTGHATGVHLHFELMHNRSPVDPLSLLTSPNKYTLKLRGHKHAMK